MQPPSTRRGPLLATAVLLLLGALVEGFFTPWGRPARPTTTTTGRRPETIAAPFAPYSGRRGAKSTARRASRHGAWGIQLQPLQKQLQSFFAPLFGGEAGEPSPPQGLGLGVSGAGGKRAWAGRPLRASRVSVSGSSTPSRRGGGKKKKAPVAAPASASASSPLLRNDTTGSGSGTAMFASTLMERPPAPAPATLKEEAAPSPSTGTSPSGSSSKKRVRARAEEPDVTTDDQDPLLDDAGLESFSGSLSARPPVKVEEEEDEETPTPPTLRQKKDVPLSEPELQPSMDEVAPVTNKRRNKARRSQTEQDWTVKTEDDVCRATINVISTGDEADLAMITPLVQRLLTRYGDRVEILHRAYVPEDKPGIRLLEIWFEGFETFQLYSRYQFLKRGKRGELTPEVVEEMCEKIDLAMYLDATGDFGPML